MFVHKNHAAGGENGSIMVGMFVFLCLASQKLSEREFFIPDSCQNGIRCYSKHFYACDVLTENKTCCFCFSSKKQ